MNLIPSSTVTDQSTGQTFHVSADMFTVGAGYVDIASALDNTNTAPAAVGSAESPFAVTDANGELFLVSGPNAVWNSSVVWGTTVVWGTSVVWGTGSAASDEPWTVASAGS